MLRSASEWTSYAEALAFLGNSLLAPMIQTERVGLEPEFWASFPQFGSKSVADALDALKRYARQAQQNAADGEDPVQQASVDYTRLFIGPPRPAAAPWETVYLPETSDTHVGFGRPTFEMQQLLQDIGLEVSNENNQYADHFGIELLYASVLCMHLAEADGDRDTQEKLETQLTDFLDAHPRAWVGKLQAAVEAAEPSSYVARLLALVKAVLASL